jgi:hypothetical protein
MSLARVCLLRFSFKSPCLSTTVFCQEPVYSFIDVCCQVAMSVNADVFWQEAMCVNSYVFFQWTLWVHCFLLRGHIYWYLYFLASKPCNSFASLFSTLSSSHRIKAFLNALTSLSLICWILWCEEESRERYEVQRAELPALVRRNVWERRQQASETTRHDPTICTSHHISLPFI